MLRGMAHEHHTEDESCRLCGWLSSGEYRAVIFEQEGTPVRSRLRSCRAPRDLANSLRVAVRLALAKGARLLKPELD
jgi:hypothetical protein